MDELNRQKANHLSIRLERCLDDIKLHVICSRTQNQAEICAEVDKILGEVRRINDRFNHPSIHRFVISSVIETPATEFIAEITARLDIAGELLNGFEIPELTRLTVLSKTLKHAVEQPYPKAEREVRTEGTELKAVSRPKGDRPKRIDEGKHQNWYEWEVHVFRLCNGETKSAGKCWEEFKKELVGAGVQSQVEFNKLHKLYKGKLPAVKIL